MDSRKRSFSWRTGREEGEGEVMLGIRLREGFFSEMEDGEEDW